MPLHNDSEVEQQHDRFAQVITIVFVLICCVVWALAIAKLVDLFRSF
jgi:hypothetical protein